MFRSQFARYFVGFTATIIAIALRLALNPLLGETDLPYITLFPTLVIIGWCAGFGPALATVALGAVAVWYFILPPPFSLKLPQEEFAVGLALFIVLGTACAVMGNVINRARQKADAAARAARESEAEFRAIFETARVGKAQADPDTGRLLRVNTALCELTGYSEAQLLDMTLGDICHSDDCERDQDFFSRLARGETSAYQVESRCVRADGDIIWVVLEVNLIRDVSGNPHRVAIVIQDVTGRKRDEESLSAITAKFESVFNQSGMFAGILDIDGYLREINDLAVDWCGYDRQQVLNKPFWETPWWRVSKVIQEQIRLATQQAAAGTIFRKMLQYWVADGTERLVDFALHPIRDESNKIVYLYPTGVDITERNRTQLALAASEARYRAQFELSSVGKMEVDAQTGRLLDVNNAFCELTGYSQDELRSMGLRDLTHPDDRARVGPIRAAFLRGETDRYSEEERFIRKDGRVAWMQVNCVLLRDAAGGPLYSMGVLLDITDRKQFERAIHESEQRFRLAADAARCIVYKVDLEAGSVAIAHGLEQVLGVRADSTLLSSEWWHKRIHPDDLKSHTEQLIAILKNAHEYNTQYRVRHEDGSWVDIEDRGRVIRGESNRAIQLVGLITDITERKRAESKIQQSEERFRTMANTTPAIIWTADPTGAITFHNQRWLDYTGIDPQDNVRDWPRLVLHPDDYERCTTAWRHALETGEDYSIEVRNRRRDGEYRWFLTRATPIRDGQGRVREWYGSSTDVHDYKLAVDALNEADLRKNEFLATLSHELRNPLSPLANGIELLKRVSNPEDLSRVRELMRRQLKHMVRLIDDLMDVSRITRNKMELRRQRVELKPLVEQAVESVRPAIDAAGHRLDVQLPSESVYLNGDSARLIQVLGNLLNNACKYTKAAGQISLDATVDVTNGQKQLVICVIDAGVGIPPDMLHRVFEMFTQIDSSLERSQGGMGIGLSLVKRLVEMHGGTVEAHSEGLGRGSKFTVRLPVIKACSIEDRQSIKEEPPSFDHRILIVDDNQAMADSLAFLLKTTGQQTFTANDGEAAIKSAEAHRPEIILLDIGLPDTSGYDVCRTIRQYPWGQDILIIAVTGWGHEEDRRKSDEAGFDGHLVKPVDFSSLMTLLAELQAAKT